MRVDVSEFLDRFAPLDGTLPDVWALGSSGADWQRVIDTVRELGWTLWLHGLDGAVPQVVATIRPTQQDDPIVWIGADGSHIRARFYLDHDEIGFDVDRRDVTTQAAMDELCDLLMLVGRITGAAVSLFHEGDWDRESPTLTYSPPNDRFELGPTST